MNTFQIVLRDDATGREATIEFESRAEYLARKANIEIEYVVLQENTVTSLVVSRRPDLFAPRL